MPTAANPALPMRPFGGRSQAAHPEFVFPLEPSVTAMTAGDILVVDSGTKDMEVNNNPTAEIVGIANISPSTDLTSGATVVRNEDVVNIAAAWPGAMFEGTTVTNATTAQVGAYAEDIRVAYGSVEGNSSGYACINIADTTGPIIRTLFYAKNYDDTTGEVKTGPESGVGVTSPRVVFTFINCTTIFGS